MPIHICRTCGAQYPESKSPPSACKICIDERQYVGWRGQLWTTPEELQRSHRNAVRLLEPSLYGVGMEPAFAIGQRALLIAHPNGNVLWDCIPLLDDGLATMIQAIGGLTAIAISHPHYYTGMAAWAEAFDCPIYLHAADRQWVTQSHAAIQFWDDESLSIQQDMTLIRCGGHFAGGTVLHWPAGAGGKGALLCGDILQVVQDRRWVSFMYSYPNLIPLPVSAVRNIESAVSSFPFDRLYGAWWGKVVADDAQAAVARSANRYVQAIQEPKPPVAARQSQE